MRKRSGLLMFAVMLLGALLEPAQARSLEDILREKGVITAEEYQQAVKEKSLVRYEPGKGIVAETADGKYLARVGGYVQLLYKFTAADDNSGKDTSDYDIRRFKLQLQGHLVSKKFGYKFQADMQSGFQTEDAYLSYKFAAPLTVQFGQYKPPQARQELTSASRQLLPDRSLANDTFNLGRDLGLQATGSFADSLVEYRVGIFNGNGPNQGNQNNQHMLAGRIDFNPLGTYKMDEAGWPSEKPLLNIGASYAMETLKEDDFDQINFDNDLIEKFLGLRSAVNDFNAQFGSEVDWDVWTLNLIARWLGATFAAEYYSASADPDNGKDFDGDGYYVQGGYQVIPSTLELVVRHSEIQSNDGNAPGAARFDKSDTSVGVNYYFKKHNLKIQSDYTMVNDDLKDGRDDNIFRLQAQFVY